MGERPFYAHTLGPPHTRADWERLERHLDKVSKLAAGFAGAFGAADWGSLAGSWHDLGKYSEDFQQYLISSTDPDASEEGKPGRVDHSTFGARHATEEVGGHRGQILAFCIAGHHAGLPDASASDAGAERGTLQFRLSAARYQIPKVGPLPIDHFSASKLKLPFKPDARNAGFAVAFFTRMLFSALIDADRLATEKFCNPVQSAERCAEKPPLAKLHASLSGYIQRKQTEASPTAVNQARARVLGDCVAASEWDPGFFSLQVPTGGGKTLSSLMFSLGHALKYNLRHVVIAVPFTTVTEQTADEYRKALGPLAERALVEHQSQIHPARDTLLNRLAAENWDAPLIVTTNVQLYESLFASAGTPCRKLHRLAKSVIVLDEAQTLPVEFLTPTLEALRELVQHYGCTVVLCTATQPALERREGFAIGIEPGAIRPIASNAAELFAVLKRVRVSRLGKLPDGELADRLARESSVLCIVNARRHASSLYDLLIERVPPETCFHLSTWMCAEHRRRALAEIRQRLKQKRPCRVVSTQLIEAGVDIDFPTVYRAPAGFDSIAQAAGRCNREGCLPEGAAYLFDTERLPPAGLLRHAAQTGRELADAFPDPLAPPAVEAYFRQFYWSQQHRWDREAVMAQFEDDLRHPNLRFQFREAARRYKLIHDEQAPVLVGYNEEARAIRDRLLRGEAADFRLLRSAQRYLVTVWPNLLDELVRRTLVVETESGMWLLLNEGAYSMEKGLCLERTGIDPELLMG